MIRKIFTLVICLTFTAIVNCQAMQFSKPQEIGWFGIAQAGKGGGGFMIKNATQNTGNYFTKYRANNRDSYEKGVAKFGNSVDSLYVHYNVNNRQNPIQVGGAERNNTISGFHLTENVFKISTDEGVTIYALLSEYGPEKDFTIIGRQKTGKFVKYIDTVEITQKYFGWNKEGASPIVYTNLRSNGNTLILSYAIGGSPRNSIGEFRFKWDDKAQWFGIEQVVY